MEPANTRSNEEAAEVCGKGVAGNCKGEGIPEWLEDFAENLGIAEVPALTDVLMTQIRNVLSKWHQGSTVFILTSQKTEIVKSASEPKSQGLLAEGELESQYVEQKSLVIVLQLITKSSTKEVNQGTIIDTRSWSKI